MDAVAKRPVLHYDEDQREAFENTGRSVNRHPCIMARIILAMSGGVDSSVAAWLLRQEGHEVIGLFMRHGQEQPSPPAPLRAPTAGWSGEGSCGKQGCCTAADAADACRVADMLDIPFYAVNFQRSSTGSSITSSPSTPPAARPILASSATRG